MTATPKEIVEAMAVAAFGRYRSVSLAGDDPTWAQRNILAALRAARDLGWRMVPVEATEEMHARAWIERSAMEAMPTPEQVFARMWSAMLAAAPDLLEEE